VRHMPVRSKAKRPKKGLNWLEKIIIAVVVIVVIPWGVYSLLQPAPAPVKTGLAPDFTLPVVNANGLTGQKISLSSFRGKVVLLEFMLTSCVHCQSMAPQLENLYQQFGSQNVVFISIAGQAPGESANDLANFIKNYRSSWIYVYDSSNMVFTSYGVQATPMFFIIAKNGQVATLCDQGDACGQTLAADLKRINV
jgi:thiol-disulfide isomerase/thioredoxin